MSAARWKRAEREIARLLGTERLPNNGAGQPDCRADGYAYQIKTRTALPTWLREAVEQAERDADAHERPVVVLNEVAQGKKAYRLAVVPWDVWRDMIGGDDAGGTGCLEVPG